MKFGCIFSDNQYSIFMAKFLSFVLIVLHGFFYGVFADEQYATFYRKLGGQVELPCRVKRMTPGIIVQWFKGNEKLSRGTVVYKDKKMSIRDTAPNEWNLVIEDLSLSYIGKYTCKTAKGEILNIAQIVIKTAPRINKEASSKKSIDFEEHSRAKLECQFSGEPTPVVTWFRGNTKNEIGIKGNVLIIPNIERYAADTYFCVAKNSLGNATWKMDVHVKFAPEVTVMNSSLHARKKEAVVMSCLVQAYPLINIYWKKAIQGENGTVHPSYKYEVTAEKKEDNLPYQFFNMMIKTGTSSKLDSGIYTCFAIGDGEVGEAEVKLTIS